MTMTQITMIAAIAATAMLILIAWMSVAEMQKKVDKLEELIANLAANQVQAKEPPKEKTLEDLVREAQIKNFEEWVNGIIDYTPYTRGE